MTKFASMTAPLVYLEKFFQIQHRMKKPGFGEVLFNRGASSDMKNFSISPSQEAEVSSLTFNYRVPAHLCRNENNALPLSCLLAVFDDVSSWPVIAFDTLHRPGVSVNLYAERINNFAIKADSKLKIVCKINKIGRKMGFIELEAMDANDVVVAFGRHVKYLDGMGKLFETAMTEPCFSTLTPQLAKIFGKVYSSTDYSNTSLTETIPLSFEDGKGSFIVAENQLNPMGTLHGGAQAIAAELFGGMQRRRSTSTSSTKLKSLEVNYISASPPGKMLWLTSETFAKEENPNLNMIKIWKDGRGGKRTVVSDAILHWS